MCLDAQSILEMTVTVSCTPEHSVMAVSVNIRPPLGSYVVMMMNTGAHWSNSEVS